MLETLNPGADFSKVGQELTVPNAITMPPGQAAAVYVTKSESSVRADAANGKLLAFYEATIGSDQDPLILGADKKWWEGTPIDPLPLLR